MRKPSAASPALPSHAFAIVPSTPASLERSSSSSPRGARKTLIEHPVNALAVPTAAPYAAGPCADGSPFPVVLTPRCSSPVIINHASTAAEPTRRTQETLALDSDAEFDRRASHSPLVNTAFTADDDHNHDDASRYDTVPCLDSDAEFDRRVMEATDAPSSDSLSEADEGRFQPTVLHSDHDFDQRVMRALGARAASPDPLDVIPSSNGFTQLFDAHTSPGTPRKGLARLQSQRSLAFTPTPKRRRAATVSLSQRARDDAILLSDGLDVQHC
ncbi:hypothetical protein EXIGLDRAFT_758601 [Exidia glandulosa HHB12029]|uniref:Uncharacterized protein n=1 Tax=Exidia glandulosa HHB12029 TaxID=1314781 RepID=A0A165R083_EXIGL|nr:hypothetical protein EXIGLDRAFT_758601 [Exidia glandulosa HHB12029]